MFRRDKSKKDKSPGPLSNKTDSIENKSLPSTPPKIKSITRKDPSKHTRENSPMAETSKSKKNQDKKKINSVPNVNKNKTPHKTKDKSKKKDLDSKPNTSKRESQEHKIHKPKPIQKDSNIKEKRIETNVSKTKDSAHKSKTDRNATKSKVKDSNESLNTSAPTSPIQTSSSGSIQSEPRSEDSQPLLSKQPHKAGNQNITKKTYTNSSKPNIRKYQQLDTSSDDENIIRDEPGIHLPKLDPEEIEFLQLVSSDNMDEVKNFLSKHSRININCVNFQGFSALHLALHNRNEELIQFLLEQPNIDISDTVLHAVKDNQLKILEKLLDAQKNISPGLEYAGSTHSPYFPDYITPLILASQEGHYEIVELLVSRGHSIPRPHPPNCTCADCKATLADDDPLDSCSTRLSIYRAIASPAYLVHVSSDPILSAFRLTAELAANAQAYRQHSVAYLQLKEDVSAFAVDLMGCCRTSEEVEILLKHNSGSRGRRHFILPRLLMAVDYKQKEFVAHPNTQQVLESYWIGSWYSWRSKTSVMKGLIVVSRVFVTPAILILSMILPNHHLVQHWKIPLNKLITHVAAYFVFLIIIFFISNQDKSNEKRGPPDTGAEPVLVLYVCGYTWSAIRMCVMQGPRRFFSELWNWGEIIMLFLFGITFILWLAAAIDVQVNDREDLERKYWNQYDPTLLSEGTFCLATICAYFRIMFLCQLNYHLGPLQVSLGKMTVDIYKYITLFAVLMLSFAAGLARFYQYYDGMVYEDEFGIKTVQVSSFTSLADTLNTLFWAIFCMAPLESADVIIENSKDPNNPSDKLENRHAFTERIGYICFACFEVITVIVVLNMLIATMSNTFQRVNDNVATEWTFGKTEVYVDYISQTTLPSPYNMIPTASGMKSILEWFRVITKRPPGAYARWSLSYCCYIERDVEASVEREYPALMTVLVQRYFREKEKDSGNSGIEAEIEALRRDFTSLKTLLENRNFK